VFISVTCWQNGPPDLQAIRAALRCLGWGDGHEVLIS
jgi:hypothetical protein